MATITPSVADIIGDGSVVLFTFATMLNGDAGSPLDWTQWADRCVQVTGTFGSGGTVVLEGSNDGTNYATLNNVQGTALSFTATNVKQIVELPRYARPRVTAGDGTTSLTVTLVVRRQNPMRT